MHAWTRRLLYEFLRTLDTLWPGWQTPKGQRADYLTEDSRTYWMYRHYKGGHRD